MSKPERKTRNFTIRFTETETKCMNEEATKQDVNVCDLVREQMMKAPYMKAARK